MLGIQDLDGALIGKEDITNKDDRRFKEGQNDDHLMTPFQCVECHFINIKGRRMNCRDSRDQLAKIAITCAILNSLWVRERSTINSYHLEGARLLLEARAWGFQENLYPMRAPSPKKGVWGM